LAENSSSHEEITSIGVFDEGQPEVCESHEGAVPVQEPRGSRRIGELKP
jgi:hypothetical protein